MAIVAALVARDSRAARDLMRAHIERSRRELQPLIADALG
jgi:DNA-binding GntR family transcriptional regulator